MKRWIVIAVIGTGALAMAAVLYRANGSKATDTGEAKFAAATVERGHIREEVSCQGTVESNLDVEIKCKASGEIVLLPFEISDPVEKEDLLLELDPVDENRSVQLAKVQLQSSLAKLAQAEQNLRVSQEALTNSRREAQANVKSAQANHADKQEKSKRMAALLEKGYASTEETETASTEAVASEASLDLARVSISKLSVEEAELELLRQDIALAESAVAADRIALEDAEQRLKETKVYAPMSGVISARMVQVGQIISSPTNNVGGGTELMTLSDLSRIFVLADIDESDIGKIEVGQPAVVTVDAYPDLHFRGEVVRVAVKGTNTSNVVTFDVKVEILDEKKDRLRPEMRADVDVLCGESDDALLVPTEAIQGFGERTFIFVPGEFGGEPSRLPVETGLSDGASTQVLAGPAEGATVLIPESEQESSWTRDNRGGPPGGMPPGMMGPPPH